MSSSSTIPIRPVLSSLPSHVTTTPPHLQQLATSTGVLNERLTLSKFVSLYHKELPIQVRVCKGFCGPSEDTSISEGDQFNVHFVKRTKIVTVEYENKSRYMIPLNSAVPFGILYNPDNNVNDAMKGYRFEKVADLLQMSTLPVLVYARKAFKGTSEESSVATNELLLIKRVVSKRLGTKQQLKVFSLLQNMEKTLSPNCAANFSTRPKDVCLFLPDIVKHLPDIFPCKAVLFNYHSNSSGGTVHQSGSSRLPSRGGATTSIVSLMHSSIETSLVVSSILEQQDMANARLLELPIDLNIMVRVESIADEDETQRLYEDTTFIYEHFNPSKLCSIKGQLASSPEMQSQFYTNIHYGREHDAFDLAAPRIIDPATRVARYRKNCPSSASVSLPEGVYQIPRKASDPIPIGSPSNSVSSSSLTHSSQSASVNSRDGSMDRHSPLCRDGANNIQQQQPIYYNNHCHQLQQPQQQQQSWRPPLPPPRKPKKESTVGYDRTPGYDYVETNPRCTTAVGGRHSAGFSDSGIALGTSFPESVTSERSFGSTGSGGAVVLRTNSGSVSLASPHDTTSGSDSGVVEARRSSVNAQFQRGHHRSHSSEGAAHSITATNVHLQTQQQQQQGRSGGVRGYRQCQTHARTPSGGSNTSLLATVVEAQQTGSSELPQGNGTATTSSGYVLLTKQSDTIAQTNDTGDGQTEIQSTSEGYSNAMPRPKSLDFNDILDDLNQLTMDIECTMTPSSHTESGNIGTPSRDSDTDNLAMVESQEIGNNYFTLSNPSTPTHKGNPPEVTPHIVAKNKSFLKAMDNFQILQLLEAMGLEQYAETFKLQQITGTLLLGCDSDLLEKDLMITSRLHRMRLLRLISGEDSVTDLMCGKDTYIVMVPGK